MKSRYIVMVITVIAVVVIAAGISLAMCGTCGSEEGKSGQAESSGAIKVNNTTCPVTGEEVDMNNPTTVEHNGKIYNLCCPSCIKAFKAEPKKYAGKAEAV